LLEEPRRTAGNRFFQQVKNPREFCFAPCQIDREREGQTLPAWHRQPAGEPGRQAVQNGKITDRVWIT
jgi:hypothetical protein